MKNSILKILHKLGISLKRYRTSDFAAINKILKGENINIVFDVGANTGQYHDFIRTSGYSESWLTDKT